MRSTDENDTPALLGFAEAAQAAIADGYPVIPLNQNKEPLIRWRGMATRDPSVINGWAKKWPDALVGVPTGLASGLLVLDVDRHTGNDGFAALKRLGLELPTTRTHITRTNGGHHYLFRYRDNLTLRNTTSVLAENSGLDVRTEGGYIVFWPAHGGKVINREIIAEVPKWLRESAPPLAAQVALSSAPKHPIQSDIERLKGALDAIPADDYSDWIKIGCALKRHPDGFDLFDDWSQKSAKYSPEVVAQKWRELPTAPEANIGSIFYLAKQNGWSESQEVAPLRSTTITERALAEATLAQTSGRIAYVPEKSCWLICDDVTGAWIHSSGAIERTMLALLSDAKETAIAAHRGGHEGALKRLAAIDKAERAGFLKGAMDILQVLAGVRVSINTFDANPNVVAFRNRVLLNLVDGSTRPIHPADKISRTLGADYVAGANCPLWRDSLNVWCAGDDERVRFLQKWCGLALSGLNEWQGFLFLHGGGRNGKSVFACIAAALSGEYAITLPPDALMRRKSGGSDANPAIARLPGARLASSVELPEGASWDVNLLKMLTGSDTITARNLYAGYFDFTSIAKLLIVGNHKPHVREGLDFAFWRRVALFPFRVTIEHPDPRLTDKLKNELSGIALWAAEGFKLYQQEGLTLPKALQDEVAEYQQESDLVGQWLEDATTPAIGHRERKDLFYQAYRTWCIAGGYYPPNSNTFGRRLNGRVKSARSNGVNYYEGRKPKTLGYQQ